MEFLPRSGVQPSEGPLAIKVPNCTLKTPGTVLQYSTEGFKAGEPQLGPQIMPMKREFQHSELTRNNQIKMIGMHVKLI